MRLAGVLKKWIGGKVLVWDEADVISTTSDEQEWQAALAAAEEREWRAARQAAEEREWRAARQAAEEREWQLVIAGAHRKTETVAPVVVKKSLEADEWATLLASAKSQSTPVVRPSRRPPERDRAWQSVFGKPRPGVSAH
jgi:hypothetical protein